MFVLYAFGIFVFFLRFLGIILYTHLLKRFPAGVSLLCRRLFLPRLIAADINRTAAINTALKSNTSVFYITPKREDGKKSDSPQHHLNPNQSCTSNIHHLADPATSNRSLFRRFASAETSLSERPSYPAWRPC